MRTRRAIFMSKVRDNSAPKMILGACWGACDRSPFLAKLGNIVLLPLFRVLKVVCLYYFQMSIVKHFSQESGIWNSEFGNIKKVKFWWLCVTISEIFEVSTKYARLERLFRYVSLFETFTSNQPFICNHHY